MPIWKAGFKCLEFVATHPGGQRRPAFPCGYRYDFDAPELKRAPFRPRTIEALIQGGYIKTRPVIALTAEGKRTLDQLRGAPFDLPPRM